MRLTDLWLTRTMALVAAVALATVVWNMAIVSDRVLTARSVMNDAQVDAVNQQRAETTTSPIMRLGGEETLEGLLAREFEPLQLSAIVVDAKPPIPIGDGLAMTEVEVRGQGSLATGRAISNWALVNHQSARMVSLMAQADAEGGASWTFVLLLVTA